MFFHFDDFDRTFARVSDWQRRLDRALAQAATQDWSQTAGFGDFDLVEDQDEIVLTADLPGVRDADIEVSLENDTLTITAKREVAVPEGYRARRTERRAFEFTRSFSLPTRVDPERVAATLADGVFSVKMAKAAEVKPRQITVQAR